MKHGCLWIVLNLIQYELVLLFVRPLIIVRPLTYYFSRDGHFLGGYNSPKEKCTMMYDAEFKSFAVECYHAISSLRKAAADFGISIEFLRA